MRPALQRILTSPPALSLLRHVIHSDRHCLRQSYPVKVRRQKHTWRSTKSHRFGGTGREEVSGISHPTKDEGTDEPFQGTRLVEYLEPLKTTLQDEMNGSAQQSMLAEQQGNPNAAQQHRQSVSWQARILTSDEVQYQSNLEARLIDNENYATDWTLWLELVRSRNRRDGLQGAQTIYRDIFRRGLQLPTNTDMGDELWDLLLQGGFEDREWMQEIISYALHVKRTTGQAWVRLYGSIVGHALRSDERLVIGWHRGLKDDFPPSVEDYRYLFKASLSGNNVSRFMHLYRDLPIIGMYATVVPELCKLQRYKEARSWHNLLCIQKDFPRDIKDIKPLLNHFALSGNEGHIEQIMKRLDYNQDRQSSIMNIVRKYVGEKEIISREFMNIKLGELHGVEPKHLGDDFCARLFATKLIGVTTIISGLQMMGVESIGPLSLREIASRADCDTRAVCQHLDRLKDAGIPPEDSTFSTVLERMAREDQHSILRSVVECDLHPDTFEDFNVQEKLLAEYYEKNEQLQFQRTLAILTCRCTTQTQRDMWRANLTLRAHTRLGSVEKVHSIMNEMQRKNIVLSTKSSQYMRIKWLSKRNRGHAAHDTDELSVLIKASQMSMQSGQYVPIIAWREIQRRLGMAGRLLEFENLTLWLADYFLGITAPSSLQNQDLPPITDKVPYRAAQELSRNTNPFSHLKVLLFHNAAQQAMVTWGFLHEVRIGPYNSRRQRRLRRTATHRPNWKWGLKLLKTLRERGVPIQTNAVARICRIRLDTLFGRGVSNRPINREAKWVNDQRARASHRFWKAYYIREMEAIWGDDLFRHQDFEDLEWRTSPSERKWTEMEPVKGPRRWTRM